VSRRDDERVADILEAASQISELVVALSTCCPCAAVAGMSDSCGTYADLRLGGTDASVIALAERQGAVRIATLNRHHFAVLRPRHVDAFELLP
jgi:predicted nucleic acid-binding protein